MNDFNSIDDYQTEDGEMPMLDADFDAPAKGSIEEAALKIDAILGLGPDKAESDDEGPQPSDEDPDGNSDNGADKPDPVRGDNENETQMSDDKTDAASDRNIDVEIDGEQTTVPLSELTDAWSKAGAVEEEAGAIRERRSEIDDNFETASKQLEVLVPALRARVLGAFAQARSPQELHAMASNDPAGYADFQERSRALEEAEGYASAISQFQRGRVLETGSEELSRLVPELGDTESGDTLRADIRAYGKDSGFDDERIAEAGAAEIAILHKAMKYDQLEKGQVKAARRAKDNKRARPVMRPGQARREDPGAGYRKAMAKLKKTGHVDDAARVIEMIL